MITLYTTHCPKCSVLERKLKEKNIKFVENTNIDEMVRLGLTEVPCLDVDGKFLGFAEAVKWINER